MPDFVEGLVEDFHKFVAANDKEAAQTAFSEVKKIFGFDDDTAKAFVDARAPQPAPAEPAAQPVVTE